MAQLFRESWDLIIQESETLVPLALTLFTLGHAGLVLGGGMVARGQLSLVTMVLVFVSASMLLWGRMAVCRLVLVPGTSVGEALRQVSAKVPFGLWILILVWLLSALTGVVGLMVLGVDLSKGAAGLSAMGGLALAPAYAAIMLLSARIFLLNPSLAARDGNMVALKEALSLSRGRTMAFFGLVMIFLLLSEFAQVIASLIAGIFMAVLSKALGQDSAAFVIVALAAGMAAAIPTLLATVFSAKLYKQLTV